MSNETSNPICAAAYLRANTGDPAVFELSIADQRRAVLEYCAARGITLTSEYVEAAVPTARDKRPELQRLMTAAHAPLNTFNY